MLSYAETCRYLANKLDIKARVIFITYPKECFAAYDVTSDKFPDAYLAIAGTCDENNRIVSSVNLMQHAITDAVMHAQEHAYLIITIDDTKGFPPQVIENIRALVYTINQLKLTPVLLNNNPPGFIRDTGLSSNDVVLIKSPKVTGSENKKRLTSYAAVLDQTRSLLFSVNSSEKNIPELNSRAASGQWAKPKALNILDIAAMLILAFSMYTTFRNYKKVKKSNKLKNN